MTGSAAVLSPLPDDQGAKRWQQNHSYCRTVSAGGQPRHRAGFRRLFCCGRWENGIIETGRRRGRHRRVGSKGRVTDGYHHLCTMSSSLIRTVYREDLLRSREGLHLMTMVSGAGGPVVAAKKTGATNLREFIEYAKKLGSLNWGSYGVGSTPHVLIATMAKQYGIDVQVIQYRGEAPMWTDVAGQTLDGAAGSYAAAAPVIQAGTGNLIGVVGSRLPPYPDTPTMTEQGAVGDSRLRAFPPSPYKPARQRLSWSGSVEIDGRIRPQGHQMLNNLS